MTATQQLVPAILALTFCVRPLLAAGLPPSALGDAPMDTDDVAPHGTENKVSTCQHDSPM